MIGYSPIGSNPLGTAFSKVLEKVPRVIPFSSSKLRKENTRGLANKTSRKITNETGQVVV